VRGALVALILMCGVASAAPGVGVVVVGEPTLQGKVRTQASAWFKLHGYPVVDKPLTSEAAKTLANCFVIEDTTCARGLYEHQAQADVLVYIRVDLLPGSRKDRDVAITGYWFQKGRDAVADKRGCKPCTTNVLRDSVAELMAQLLDQSGLEKARISVASPPGLVVMLDGTNVGITPIEQDVPPGDHLISLEREGKEVGSTKITAAIGATTEVTVPINSVPLPTTTSQAPVIVKQEAREGHRPSRIVPGLLIVGGLGAIAVGGTYIYLGTRTGPDDPYIYRDANRIGIISSAAGGVALLTGLILWWHGTATSGPTAMTTPGGTMVGWVGQF
jgi:hypothetical protein